MSLPSSTTTLPRTIVVTGQPVVEALIGRVVGAVVHAGGGDRHVPLRIPDRNIGVGVDRD
jgi:hypothetical protein